MKKTNQMLRQNMNGNRNRIFQGISIALVVILMCTINTNAQSCKKTSEKKPSTADVLYDVVNGNHLEKLKVMVEEHGANINETLENKETVLTLASWHGYSEMASYAIKQGIEVDAKNKWNCNALANACMQGHNDILAMLIKAGADINERFFNDNTGLHCALNNGHIETAALLVKSGADITLTNTDGESPIFMASWRGDPGLLKSLIDKGADVNTTISGNSILHNLANRETPKSTAMVLEKGANANVLDSEGRLPLHIAVIEGNIETANLLIKATKNVNQCENILGNTPLHVACINGDVKTALALIEAGAKTDITNQSGKTPLFYAIKHGNVDLVNAFKEKKLASEDDLVMAKKAMNSGTEEVLQGKAKVSYTGHSGWVVQTGNNVLVFDYWDNSLSSNRCLANGALCPKEMKDKNIYVFVSHDHQDHFDTKIFEWAKQAENITYIYGFEPEKSQRFANMAYDGPTYSFIPDNQTKTIGNAKISTHKSNDTGQGFLVSINGITIYHPGDHALFTEEDRPFFVQEVDLIAKMADKVDLAFLPVSGCPSRWQKEYIVDGFFYIIDKLNPKQVFPMHALNSEYKLKEFAELAEQRKIKTQIVCAEYRGDSFICSQNLSASK